MNERTNERMNEQLNGQTNNLLYDDSFTQTPQFLSRAQDPFESRAHSLLTMLLMPLKRMKVIGLTFMSGPILNCRVRKPSGNLKRLSSNHCFAHLLLT